MSYLDILKEARKLKKQNKESNLKVAILGSKSMQFIGEGIRVAFAKENIQIQLYVSDYDGIISNIIDPNSEFYKEKPDVCIIIPDVSDIKVYPELRSDDINLWVENEVTNWTLLWQKIQEKLPNITLIQTNYVVPSLRVLGQIENGIPSSRTRLLNTLNQSLMQNKGVHIIDVDSIANYVGKKTWFDKPNYYLSKMPFNMEYLGIYVSEIIQKYNAITKASKKVLVLDLDNTLWGGVIGDEGYENINLDPNDALGEAFLDFQDYIIELYNRGVLLAIASKNDYEVAVSGFNNKYMRLTQDMFSSIQAHWKPKSVSMENIAHELNLGIDSLVFFDDNPFERNIVREFTPEVQVIEVPVDPALYIDCLDTSLAFNVSSLTSEDMQRNKSYQDNKKRAALQNNFQDYDRYLQSLDMKYTVEPITQNNVERFTQLTNKSNQFNLCTRRYTDQDIQTYLLDPNYYLFGIQLEDKFSDYGMIACIILHKEKDTCVIENWVMSCRVLKRNVEACTMNEIVNYAKEMNVETIVGEYIPTSRNQMVQDLLTQFNFKNNRLSIDTYEPIDIWMEKRND